MVSHYAQSHHRSRVFHAGGPYKGVCDGAVVVLHRPLTFVFCVLQFTCDRWFGLLKKRLHGKQGCGADTIEQLMDVCNKLSKDEQKHKGCSTHHRLDGTNCPTFFSISDALAPFFTPLKHIGTYHEFLFEASNPGHVKVIKRSQQEWKTIDLRSSGYDIAKVRAVDIMGTKLRGPMLPPKRVKYLREKIKKHIPAKSKARFMQEVEWLAKPALASDDSELEDDVHEDEAIDAGATAAAEDSDGGDAEERVVMVRMPEDLDGTLVRMKAPDGAITRDEEWCHDELCESPFDFTPDNPLVGCDWCVACFHIGCFPGGATDPALDEDELFVACEDCFPRYCIH